MPKSSRKVSVEIYSFEKDFKHSTAGQDIVGNRHVEVQRGNPRGTGSLEY